jgi:uncharacterized membrane protein YkvA (DUF1232 family)
MGSFGALQLAGGINGLLLNVRLAWRLWRDGRVPLRNKLIVPAAVLYLVWPLDLLIDLLPFLGQVDDVTALVLAVLLFVRSSPQRIVTEHRDALTGVIRQRARAGRDDVIEGRYRVLDDEERR